MTAIEQTAEKLAADVEIVVRELGDPRDPYVYVDEAATRKNVAAAILGGIVAGRAMEAGREGGRTMKQHPRHVPMEMARRDLQESLSAWWGRHQMTEEEERELLAEVLFARLRRARQAGWERQGEAEPQAPPA